MNFCSVTLSLRSAIALPIVAGLVACGDSASEPLGPDAAPIPMEPDAAPMEPDPVSLRSVTGGFIAPESAHWDSENNVWYVSNYGQMADLSGQTPDAPGFISRIGADGTVIDERWLEMDGDFVGMATMDGMLYVSHGRDLIEIEIATKTVNTVDIPGAAFLNDVATGGGNVYVSDTVTNTIFRYTPGETPVVFSQDESLAAPNGLYVDGDSVVVATLGAFPPNPAMPGAIYWLDGNGIATRLGSLSGLFDGIEKVDDSYIVSDFGGSVYLVDADDGSEELVANFAVDPHNLMATADIGFDPSTRTVMIPDLIGQTLHWFVLP